MTHWTIALAGSLPEALDGLFAGASSGGTCDLVVTDRVRAELPDGRIVLVTGRTKATRAELRLALSRSGADAIVLAPGYEGDELASLLNGLDDTPDLLAALERALAGREFLVLGRAELGWFAPDSPWFRGEDALGGEELASPRHDLGARPSLHAGRGGGSGGGGLVRVDREDAARSPGRGSHGSPGASLGPRGPFPGVTTGIDGDLAIPRDDRVSAVTGGRRPGGGQHAEPPERRPEPVGAEPPPAAAPEATPPESTGSRGASSGPRARRDARLLQCRVSSGRKGAARDNIVVAGRNVIDVFIGPREPGSIAGPSAPQELLGFTPGVNEVTVTVVLTPLRAGAKPVSKPLVIPRAGRSADVRLRFRIPAGLTELRAQLMVLAGNRVIQSAVLVAEVGKKARLTERLVLWPKPADVTSRVRFDGAAVATATPSGPALVTHADGVTTIEALPEVTAALGRIRHLVATASQEESATPELGASLDRRLLIDIAVEGNDLYSQISDRLGPLASAQRIQLVTSRAGAYLPLELMYDRPAPAENARLCQTWVDGGDCGEECFSSPGDTSVVCPHVFWGLSRVIERHQAPLEGTAIARLVADPALPRNPLALGRAVIAASQLVDDADVAEVAVALGTKAVRAATWTQWQAALAAEPTQLLVLMPHNDDGQGALEVNGEFLRRGRIEAPYVTGGHAGLAPAVVLLGCDTAGSQSDPAGYATRFMACGAGVVFSTFTPVLASDAAQVARRLASALVDEQRPEMPAADVLRTVRAAAIRDGFPVALAVTAYGDADWTV